MDTNEQQVSNGKLSSHTQEKLEMQPVTMIQPTNKSGLFQTYQKPSKTHKCILAAVLTLGLVLYISDVSLHVTIASKYLNMRNCSRNLRHTIDNFRLDKLVDLNQVVQDLNPDVAQDEKGTNETDTDATDQSNNTNKTKSNDINDESDSDPSVKDEPSFEENIQNLISSKLDEFITDNIYVKLREKVFKILPEHWKQRIIDIVTFQVGRHSISSVPDICVVNDQTKLNRLSQMALYICSNTLEGGSLDSPEGQAIQGALVELVPTRLKEDQLIKHAINGHYMVVIQDILANNFNASTLKRVNQVMDTFQSTFNEPGELKTIMGLLTIPKISANLGNLTNALGSIDPENLNGAANALAKIDPNNMGKLEELLGQLNITLATLIVDPTVFLSFLGDPEKGKILVELQKYLPQFEPREINDFLTIKIEIDEKIGPDAGEILGSVLALPMSLLRKVCLIYHTRLKYHSRPLHYHVALQNSYLILFIFQIFSLRLADEDIEALKGVADKFLGSEDSNISSLVNFVTTKWKLLTEEGRSSFAHSCSMKKLSVVCRDTSIDLCPNGHLLYGTATACVLALPGIIFAISEFLHYRYFRFAEVFQLSTTANGDAHPKGSSLSFSFSCFLLPFYIVIMIPFIAIATVYQ